MDKPHSGTWVGTVALERAGAAVQFVLDLQFADDGTVTGRFTVSQGAAGKVSGLTEGVLRGGYSRYGSLHFEFGSADAGAAVFEGLYEVPYSHSGVIRGTVLISRGDDTETGTLAAVYAKVKAEKPTVW